VTLASGLIGGETSTATKTAGAIDKVDDAAKLAGKVEKSTSDDVLQTTKNAPSTDNPNPIDSTKAVDKTPSSLGGSEIPILPQARSANEIRNSPGLVTGGSDLPNIDGRWLKGSDGNLGIVPGQLTEQLSGQEFKSFDDFREAFWEQAAKDPGLASQFSKANQTRMSQGLAPIAPQTQHLGQQKSYILHHKTPIQHGGGVYNLDNIVIVTPRLHKEILEGRYHY
jgi:hypothetical protein